MIEMAISRLDPAPLHAMEIWSNPAAVAKRWRSAVKAELPGMGKSASTTGLVVMRFEPTVWLVEGNVFDIVDVLEKDGSLTAIGGGIVRFVLGGQGWRRLLMEGGVFDAESASFGLGDCAATVIDHVGVRLHVRDADECVAYVPASFAADIEDFWRTAAISG